MKYIFKIILLSLFIISCQNDQVIKETKNKKPLTKCDLNTNYCKWDTKFFKRRNRDCCWVIGKVTQQDTVRVKVYEHCPCGMNVKYNMVDSASLFCY